MASLPRPAVMRLQRDYKQLLKEPLVGTHAEPTDDISLWNGCLHVPVRVNGKQVNAPLHFLIEFPSTYPMSPPNAGFTSDFRYNMGASYIAHEGRLNGCKVICLDLLGNFGDIHTEWKDTQGSGWSPAYSVSTLLINLQSIVCDMGSQMSQAEQQRLYQAATQYAKDHPDDVPQVLSQREVMDKGHALKLQEKLASLIDCSEQAVAFAKKAGILSNESLREEFIGLISNIVGSADADATALAPKRMKPLVDSNIVCYSTGILYTEGTLGYGISVARRGRQVNLSTPAELLSHQAFSDGLRQSTSKVGFEMFLPAFINPAHAYQNPKWTNLLNASLMKMGKLYNCLTLEESALSVFPKLINTMLAEIMSPATSKSAAIAFFEALLSFWRTFHYLLSNNKKMAVKCQKILRNFVEHEDCRLKSVTPDVGALFAMYACCPSGAPSYQSFLAAYVDEAYVRSVLFWIRKATPLESRALFAATEIGRNIAMFQSIFVKQLVGAKPTEFAAKMDASNGKLPEQLANLQQLWRRHLKETNNWTIYFQRLGLSATVGKPICSDIAAWAQRCLQRAKGRGSAYFDSGSRSRGRGNRNNNYDRRGGNGNGNGYRNNGYGRGNRGRHHF